MSLVLLEVLKRRTTQQDHYHKLRVRCDLCGKVYVTWCRKDRLHERESCVTCAGALRAARRKANMLRPGVWGMRCAGE